MGAIPRPLHGRHLHGGRRGDVLQPDRRATLGGRHGVAPARAGASRGLVVSPTAGSPSNPSPLRVGWYHLELKTGGGLGYRGSAGLAGVHTAAEGLCTQILGTSVVFGDSLSA
jgi:hypothetical protein